MNFLKFICNNNILSLDKLFCQFVNDLDTWWLNHTTDLSYELTRIHSFMHTIIINVDEVVQLYIPDSNNYNDVLILACLINMQNKRTVSHVNFHVQIIMCAIKFNFIDKKSLKIQLKELVNKNYIMIDTQNIYNLNNEKIMNEINKHIHNNIYVNKIMSLSRESYYITAAFYNLPSIFNPTNKIKIQNLTNKTHIFSRFQKKFIFIKDFINSILQTHFLKLTTDTIQENYLQYPVRVRFGNPLF
ncbi:uncharacterized protein LOC132943326 [Metopolophium dirhodum]|uniref:uncharacterized protein LOC132943326 n=1 Tax=Metopolophium dirhodum TaxID=44670 RepID=UPI00298F981F|nr:uncharacterized protein LOC132943326 [Metopolophium dirhodum]